MPAGKGYVSSQEGSQECFIAQLDVHRIHVWYSYLHLVDLIILVGKSTIHGSYGMEMNCLMLVAIENKKLGVRSWNLIICWSTRQPGIPFKEYPTHIHIHPSICQWNMSFVWQFSKVVSTHWTGTHPKQPLPTGYKPFGVRYRGLLQFSLKFGVLSRFNHGQSTNPPLTSPPRNSRPYDQGLLTIGFP